jgi:hypothetical protein
MSAVRSVGESASDSRSDIEQFVFERGNQSCTEKEVSLRPHDECALKGRFIQFAISQSIDVAECDCPSGRWFGWLIGG